MLRRNWQRVGTLCRIGTGAMATCSVQMRWMSSESEPKAAKLWGGRFSGETDPLMEEFNASIGFDKRMWAEDIEGSQAYARALFKAGILTDKETNTLVDGLNQVAKEWEAGTFEIQASDEDIHTANERRLTELVGSVGGKLHTGRSRNDQVATDLRLYLRGALDHVQEELDLLLLAFAERAEAEAEVLMPGYTHLQPAQPIRWSHLLLAHAAALQRDAERFHEVRKRLNRSPLGSGALAGHPFGIDREALASDLGFDSVCPNSLDAVSDRDFVADTLYASSMLAVHLSKFAEDLILYTSPEFGFISLSDAYSTGSSLMPQKKNPDALELLRGKAGRPVGALTGFLVTLKGIPSTYNKDLQEDKEPVFATIDTVSKLLPISRGVLSTLTIHPDRMHEALWPDMLATDLADYLVRRGVPFRETHHVAGEAVKLAEDKGVPLTHLTAEDLKPLHPKFDDDVAETVWSFIASVEARNSTGGTAENQVRKQAKLLREWVLRNEANIEAGK